MQKVCPVHWTLHLGLAINTWLVASNFRVLGQQWQNLVIQNFITQCEIIKLYLVESFLMCALSLWSCFTIAKSTLCWTLWQLHQHWFVTWWINLWFDCRYNSPITHGISLVQHIIFTSATVNYLSEWVLFLLLMSLLWRCLQFTHEVHNVKAVQLCFEWFKLDCDSFHFEF